MKHSITYLDNATVVTFEDGEVVIIDENVEGWKELRFADKWLEFVHDDGRYIEFYVDGNVTVHYGDGPQGA